MNRRLRKKKRVGEFQELGFEVSYRIAPQVPEDARNELLWRFIIEAVEANGLAVGGGGGEDHNSFVVSARIWRQSVLTSNCSTRR